MRSYNSIMRTLYDSVNINAIPANPEMVAGYVNGRWPTYNSLIQKFPQAVHVSIAVTANADAQVLDVETGDATPGQAPAWAQRQRQEGRDPTVYCNSSTWGAVRQAFQNARVAEPHYWIAQYDNNPTIPAGAVAKQYRSDTNQDLDYSVVADYWPGVDSAPAPPPPVPAPTYTQIQGDPDVAVRIVDTIRTDGNGSGWNVVAADLNKIVSISVEGFDPATQGVYWHDAGVSFAATGKPNETIIAIANSSVKSGNVGVVVWVAA